MASTAAPNPAFERLVEEMRVCAICRPHLTLGPRPILRGRPSARLLLISRTHATGLSFDDMSGERSALVARSRP
jgi:uracil-DNA glycosylase